MDGGAKEFRMCNSAHAEFFENSELRKRNSLIYNPSPSPPGGEIAMGKLTNPQTAGGDGHGQDK